MSTAVPNQDPNPDAFDAAAGEEASAAKPRRNWILPVALIAVAALFILSLVFMLGGKDSDEASGDLTTSEQQDESTDAEAPAEGGYVDDSGQQEQELTAFPTTVDDVEEMTLSLGADSAPIDFVQLTVDGTLIPPEDVSRLGWYVESAVPGSQGGVGSTVITGHVNHQTQGQGFAYNFTQLNVGDTVTIDVDGQPAKYKVTKAPFRVAKGEDMPAEVNDTSGENMLVLITCGGEFVGGALGYADNIFVIAEPA
ncbi:Sortase family protein [Corynebacterium glaucum]|uniref:Sortase family protein n=1 Tax=Corynebacterium glaucum TaxID=187491 RepID=A0A1Q2HZ67_9CORY|nr:class F sortase [Corynebacterium glaucum]AQQ16138.1 Sortase family protein [Corynebacterium glaucum]